MFLLRSILFFAGTSEMCKKFHVHEAVKKINEEGGWFANALYRSRGDRGVIITGDISKDEYVEFTER